MKEILPIITSVFHGLKDALLGMTSLITLAASFDDTAQETSVKEEPIREGSLRQRRRKVYTKSSSDDSQRSSLYKMILECCLLNGGIFWLSIFLFESYFIPLLNHLTKILFKSGSTESAIWQWMIPTLSYLFSTFWVIPLFWLSKPLNMVWFQEVADTAYRKTRGRPIGFFDSVWGLSLTQNIGRFIADLLFSLLIQVFFLVQSVVVGLIPIAGPLLSVMHMCVLYSLYTFEYKWINMGWVVHKRLSYIECNWPYFVGFGLPLAILTSLPSSFVVSGCVFAILFPLFIVSANAAKPIEINHFPIRIFSFVVWLGNKVFTQTTGSTQAKQTQNLQDNTNRDELFQSTS